MEMEMLNFNAHKIRDLQNYLTMLNQCESEGVTDIRFVRERLQNHINEKFKERRVDKKGLKAERKMCKSCGNGVLVGPYKVDGNLLFRCTKKCGYSELIT